MTLYLKTFSMKPGLHYGQVSAVIETSDGEHLELLVDEREQTFLGCVIVWGIDGSKQGDKILVEFPVEASNGAWRAWVPAKHTAVA